MHFVRALYKYWAAIILLAVIVQVGFAGYGAFYTAGKVDDPGTFVTHDQFEHGWDYHAGFGYGVVLGGLILLVLSLVARIGRPWTLLALGLAVLLIVQVLLAWIGFGTPVVGAFHPINAFVILALSGFLVQIAWRKPAASST